jgi:hypothetical protein
MSIPPSASFSSYPKERPVVKIVKREMARLKNLMPEGSERRRV